MARSTPARTRTRKTVRRRPGPTGEPAAADDPVQVRLRTGRGDDFGVKAPALTGRDALFWAYVAKSRSRWSGEQHGGETEALLRMLGQEEMRSLAEAGLVEVVIPFPSEAASWPARVLPWEYLLSKATKPFRKQPLVVVRRLSVAPGPPMLEPPRSALLALSAPSGLGRFFDTALEGELLAASLGMASPSLTRLTDPTRGSLALALAERKPDLLHLGGADTHQAAALLGLKGRLASGAERDGALRDGFVLAPDGGADPDCVDADALAALVGGATPAPRLVGCNFFNSAARVAPLLVAAGAGAAVGFQDTIAADLAATFYACFYRGLSLEKRPLLEAWLLALNALRGEPGRLRGACVVLWSARPLLATASLKSAAGLSDLPPAVVVAGRRRGKVKARVTGGARPGQSKKAASTALGERLRAEIKPVPAFNYSLLQNRRTLFEAFTLWNLGDEPLDDVDLEVMLHVGAESCRFEKRLTLPPARPRDLRSEIAVPLTAALLRTPSERLATVLSVKVRVGEDEVLKDSFPVRLNPADEWTDTDRDRQWLPCFVLPGDPAVQRVVAAAERYLVALADDPAAGFDGYQQLDESDGAEKADLSPVDLQVQALWSALILESPLGYINPPPSYSAAGQRLRSPSRILQERRGTCIDLALLFAACLEYVGLYPVLFLLEGHAFPGYWRSERTHDSVGRLETVFLPPEGAGPAAAAVRVATREARGEHEFVLGRDDHYQVQELVRRGLLAPLETVSLTARASFGEALEEGRANLRAASEFEALIDVAWAREDDVLPLPLLWRPE
jgi:hypothetical protein